MLSISNSKSQSPEVFTFLGLLQGFIEKLTQGGYQILGNIQGNVFTYMFGPQFKKHSGKVPALWRSALRRCPQQRHAAIADTITGVQTGQGNNNAFAMEFGGGLDIPLTKTIQVRPVEVDYLYTNSDPVIGVVSFLDPSTVRFPSKSASTL